MALQIKEFNDIELLYNEGNCIPFIFGKKSIKYEGLSSKIPNELNQFKPSEKFYIIYDDANITSEEYLVELLGYLFKENPTLKMQYDYDEYKQLHIVEILPLELKETLSDQLTIICKKVEYLFPKDIVIFISENSEISYPNKNFASNLRLYMEITPREEIEQIWNLTKELDDVGPTMEEFFTNHNLINNMKNLSKEAVKEVAINLSKLNGVTSSKEVKEQLRIDGYWATQSSVSALLNNLVTENILKFTSNGTFRVYQLVDDVPQIQSTYKYVMKNGTVIPIISAQNASIGDFQAYSTTDDTVLYIPKSSNYTRWNVRFAYSKLIGVPFINCRACKIKNRKKL